MGHVFRALDRKEARTHGTFCLDRPHRHRPGGPVGGQHAVAVRHPGAGAPEGLARGRAAARGEQRGGHPRQGADRIVAGTLAGAGDAATARSPRAAAPRHDRAPAQRGRGWLRGSAGRVARGRHAGGARPGRGHRSASGGAAGAAHHGGCGAHPAAHRARPGRAAALVHRRARADLGHREPPDDRARGRGPRAGRRRHPRPDPAPGLERARIWRARPHLSGRGAGAGRAAVGRGAGAYGGLRRAGDAAA